MATLSEVKKSIEFNTGLSALIEVLKNISVAQFRSLESKVTHYDKFFKAIEGFFEVMDLSLVEHIFLKPRQEMQLIVAVTFDSGMVGGLNNQVVYQAMAELQNKPGKLIIIGEKGKTFGREMGLTFSSFTGIRDEERLMQALQLRDYIVDRFKKDKAGYLKIIYPRAISFTVQRVETLTVFPFAKPENTGHQTKAKLTDFIVESSLAGILEYLAFSWLGQKIFDIFTSTRLAEFGARFVHLEGSAQRLKDMDVKLRLQYFKSRHEIIDRNMRELFSARLLYG